MLDIKRSVRGAFGACANKQGVVWSVSGEGMSTDSEGNGDPQPSKEKEKETKQAYVPVSSYRYLFRTYPLTIITQRYPGTSSSNGSGSNSSGSNSY